MQTTADIPLSILGDLKTISILDLARGVVNRNVPGVVAEVGVYRGGVLRELAGAFPERKVYGYDTFEGMPEDFWREGEVVQPGWFADTSLEKVRDAVSSCKNVVLVPGMFPSTGIDDTYAFVHLDVDFYASTLEALKWLAPRMAQGGVIVLDDWDWPQCPGVREAVEELNLHADPTVIFQAAIYF